jgi:hypothetical protein
MDIHVRALSRLDLFSLEAHFIALGAEDRRLRFGVPLNDDAVLAYVAADAWLRLPPADAGTHFGEVFAERVAVFDYALKQGRSWLAPGR